MAWLGFLGQRSRPQQAVEVAKASTSTLGRQSPSSVFVVTYKITAESYGEKNENQISSYQGGGQRPLPVMTTYSFSLFNLQWLVVRIFRASL